MAAFLSATMWQQKLLVIHCISIFIGIPTVTLPSLILGTLSHSASASCQHGTPGKIIEDFWKITRGSRREDLICFYFLCIREFRCLQFACFLTFFCLGISLHSSVVFHFTGLVFLMSLHFTHFLFPWCHVSAQVHSTRMGEQQRILSPSDAETGYYLNTSMSKYWSLPSFTNFPSSSCTPFTKAPSRPSKAANGCALGKPTINNCG